MAETIISPGVFTQENDLSFLPQGIGAIGACIIGPTVKGPAFVPTLITRGFKEFEDNFGPQDANTYVPFAVKEYLRNAGSVTVVRVLAGGGYLYGSSTRAVAMIVEEDSDEIIAVLAPSKQNVTPSTLDLLSSSMAKSAAAGGVATLGDEVVLQLSGAGISVTNISASFDSASSNYITKVLGTTPTNNKTGANSYGSGGAGTKPAFAYINFQSLAATSSTAPIRLKTGSLSSFFTSSQAEGYDHASTPMITSGYLDATKNTTQLFKFHALNDGDKCNTDYKISIAGLRPISDIDGIEQYTQFTVQIRKYDDTDRTPSVLEQFNNVTLDPNSPTFISRVIGDRYQEYSEDFGKVITKGDYPNISKFVRVEVTQGVKEGSLSPKLEPRGFTKVNDTINFGSEGGGTYKMPAFATASQQLIGGVYSSKAYLGWDFTQQDNKNWNKPVPLNTVGGSPIANKGNDFNVDEQLMHPSASSTYAAQANASLSASVDITGTTGPRPIDLKFSVPFQGGLDGLDPATVIQTGEHIAADNLYGYDLSTTGATGYKGYKKALDIMSNQDEYDINMLVLPGVIKNLHASVTDAAVNMVEDRADAFYVMDLSRVDATVATAVNDADGLDSNYAAVYYPWVKVLDTSINKPIFVPPSVIVPGAIAASDRIGAEWFAPAGLNRGVLGTVLEAKNRLNQAERDELYEGRVNPIATFPATGVCIWGQKTLQVRPTALDRINVRRLLITVKKFIASSSKYLVFEQNTIQTRNRFLNIVNPYLESIQQRQGLFAFRVVMDETNNTPAEIDRNRLIGAIYLQPAKTAEFIVLDFNILPTGATFDGGGGGGSY